MQVTEREQDRVIVEFDWQVIGAFARPDGTLIVTLAGNHRYRVWKSRGKIHKRRLS